MDEILVHITAPTTRKDDDIYRDLADAYHSFEPIPADVPEDHNEQEHIASSLPESFATSFPTSLDVGTQYLRPELSTSTTSKESYGSFPSHVPSDPKDRSPGPSSDQYSLDSMADSAVDSSRMAQLEKIQQKWKKERTQNLRSSGVPHSTARSSIADLEDTDFLEDTQLGAQAIHSQLPDYSWASVEDLSEDESKPASNNPPSDHSAPGELENNGPQNVQPEIDLDPTPADIVSTPQIPAAPSKPDEESPANSTVLEPPDDGPPDDIDFSGLPYEVVPPAPKTSTEAPGALPSQMTMYLEGIKAQSRDRFKPTTKLRRLESDERGCWLVETNKWPQRTQYNFWSSLCRHVQNGNLGWGVFLYREPPKDESVRLGLGQVRVYCWGEIVEEMWLVLRLCSGGKISGTGSRWLDAEEKVIIQVP